MTWKAARGEDLSDEAPVFTGKRGPLTRHGVWRAIKGLMAAVGLDPRYAVHSLRHTYATCLYRASGADLEVVMEQLGHASIKTTTIYARVTKEDKLRAANALAKAYPMRNGSGRRLRIAWPEAAGGPRTHEESLRVPARVALQALIRHRWVEESCRPARDSVRQPAGRLYWQVLTLQPTRPAVAMPPAIPSAKTSARGRETLGGGRS